MLACDNGMYPPRSILEIFGEENRSASRIVVEISGATTKLSEEIPLPQGIKIYISYNQEHECRKAVQRSHCVYQR